ncbi:MAG: aminotransferase class V-fold PLP-dependent enzyme, partial [Syntrophobacteraceae bacterium]|nr:aminotransferase class V-fold PLP-dependent enzyme [Syntrophobacteraceae bacterium]
LGAPKGIGALYFRENTRLMPLIHGGIQENGRRGGTENVPGIVALGKAAELARAELPHRSEHMRKLRDLLMDGIRERVEKVKLTGHPKQRLPGHVSFCVEAIEGESLIFMLAQSGIHANTGSACASKALKTSPVLVAIGVPADLAQGSVVFTLSGTSKVEEIEHVLEKFPAAVDRLRMLSPIWGREMSPHGEAVCA